MRRGNQPGEGAKPTLDRQHLQKPVEEASLETAESFAADYMAFFPRFTTQICPHRRRPRQGSGAECLAEPEDEVVAGRSATNEPAMQ
jgi:hypothetical protein